MKTFEKSELIKAGIRKSFQTGNSKLARRKCYGYDIGPDGTLRVNPDEANVVRWIFEQYQLGQSLGKIADGLAQRALERLRMVWPSRRSPPLPERQNGTVRRLTNCSPTKNIQAEYCYRRRSARGFLRSTTTVS